MNKTGTRVIETHRLILRPFRVEDADDMFANWAGDPEVTRYLTWPAHPSVGVTRSLLADWTARYDAGDYFNWVIVLKESGRAVGNIAVVSLQEPVETAEVGYCLGRAYWGRGLMPEALRAVIGYLLDTAGLNRVTARHDLNNPNSGRVMQKAGMRREGIFRQGGLNNQGLCDVALYAALRSDFAPEPAPSPREAVVRLARYDDLDRVNELRRQVNDLHVSGEPGFGEALQNHIYTIWDDPAQDIVVAESDGSVCGYAVLNHIVRPENPYMLVRDYLDIDEFGVDRDARRQGIGSAMIRFIRAYAADKGYHRIELNMWAFNRGALAFYEAAGFDTYRRYMTMDV